MPENPYRSPVIEPVTGANNPQRKSQGRKRRAGIVMGGLVAGGMSGAGVGALIGLCLAVMTLISHQITLDKLLLVFVAYTAFGAFLGSFVGTPLGLVMGLVTSLSPERHGRAVSCVTVFLWGMVACMFGGQYGALTVADPQNASVIWYWIGPIAGAIAGASGGTVVARGLADLRRERNRQETTHDIAADDKRQIDKAPAI